MDWDGQRFVITCQRYENAACMAAGFKQSRATWKWYSPDVICASRFIKFASAEARWVIKSAQSEEDSEIAASQAATSELYIPVPEGLAYDPWEKAAVEYALRRTAVLVGDPMGLGKTVSAMALINHFELRSILCIGKASLKQHLKNHFDKWCVHPLRTGIATARYWPATDVVIINYDIVHKLRRYIDSRKWDLILIDEVHKLKNPKARRTMAAFGSPPDVKGAETAEKYEPIKAAMKCVLSGTPLPKDPGDIWSTLNYLQPGRWGTHGEFRAKYCKLLEGRVVGYRNLEELQRRLRVSVMIRRDRAILNLPPKRRQIVCLDLGEEGLHAVRVENEAESMALASILSASAAAELAKCENESAYKAAVEKLKECRGQAKSMVAKARLETAIAKIPAIVEHVTDAIDEGDKVIIFGHHHVVIDRLSEAFRGISVVVDGRVDVRLRQGMVDRFQADDKIRLFIGSIGAAGEGYDLTAGWLLMMAELDWLPSNVNQCEDRPFRRGQKRAVLVQHLVLDGSIDARMAKVTVSRQEMYDKCLDGAPPLDAEIGLDEVREAGGDLSVARLTREQIEKAAMVITLQRMTAARQGLAELIKRGGGKGDRAIIESLARCSRLSPKHAVLAENLCMRYARDLSGSGIVFPEKLAMR